MTMRPEWAANHGPLPPSFDGETADVRRWISLIQGWMAELQREMPSVRDTPFTRELLQVFFVQLVDRLGNAQPTKDTLRHAMKCAGRAYRMHRSYCERHNHET